MFSFLRELFSRHPKSTEKIILDAIDGAYADGKISEKDAEMLEKAMRYL